MQHTHSALHGRGQRVLVPCRVRPQQVPVPPRSSSTCSTSAPSAARSASSRKDAGSSSPDAGRILFSGVAALLVLLGDVAPAPAFWPGSDKRDAPKPDKEMMQRIADELASQPAPGAALAPDRNDGSRSPSSTAPKPPAKPVNPKAKLGVKELSELLGIPQDAAKSIMGRERGLGKLLLTQAQASHAALLRIVTPSTPLPERTVARLVAKYPKVLTVTDLEERFTELRVLLQAGEEAAGSIVTEQPGLLTHTPATLQGRLANLCRCVLLPLDTA